MLKKLLLFSLLLSTFSYSIINIEPPVIGEKEGISGEIGLGAKFSSGNTDSLSASFGGRGEYSEKEWLILLIASYTYEESNDIRDKNYGHIHFRYIHAIADTDYDYELFLQAEFDEFQAINERNLAGANIRKKLDLPFDKFYVGLGLFNSYMAPNNNFDPTYKRVRINSYISFLKKVNEYFSVAYLGYYQPNIEDFSDFRTSQTLQFNTSITNKIVLGLDIKHAYNSTPYHEIEKSDVRSTLNLRYKFK